jgi:isocitrate dehydrogenase kinase/phosphatase
LTGEENRAAFLRHHHDLLEARWWQSMQHALSGGGVAEVLSYPERVRFAPP